MFDALDCAFPVSFVAAVFGYRVLLLFDNPRTELRCDVWYYNGKTNNDEVIFNVAARIHKDISIGDNNIIILIIIIIGPEQSQCCQAFSCLAGVMWAMFCSYAVPAEYIILCERMH